MHARNHATQRILKFCHYFPWGRLAACGGIYNPPARSYGFRRGAGQHSTAQTVGSLSQNCAIIRMIAGCVPTVPARASAGELTHASAIRKGMRARRIGTWTILPKPEQDSGPQAAPVDGGPRGW